MPTNSSAAPKTWMPISTIKRLLMAVVVIVIVKYAIYDFSKVVDNVMGSVQSSYINAVKPLSGISYPDHKVLSFGRGISNNHGLLNSTPATRIEKSHEEEIAALVAKNPIAYKNKAVYLPLSNETRNTVWQLNEDRKHRVEDVCRTKNLRKEVTLENLKKIKHYTNVVVDDKNKLLFCYIPKVGCTSWKVKLALQNHNAGTQVLNSHPSPVDTRSGLAKYGIKMLSTYNLEQIKYRMENYYKFVFVRHPMERIVSSYRSKFERRKDNGVEWPFFYNTFGNQIRQIARKNKSDTKSDITFEEFVKFVVHKSGFEAFTDDHWEQYNKLCHMCLIDYDFIGKFDQNMVDDTSYVLRKITNDEKDCWFPNVTVPRSASKYLEKYFGKIPDSLIDSLEEGYSLDFEMFSFNKGLSAKLNKTQI